MRTLAIVLALLTPNAPVFLNNPASSSPPIALASTFDAIKEWQGNKAALTRFYDNDLNVACYVATTSGELDLASIPQSPPTMTCIKVK